MWLHEKEEYRTSEIGSGVQKFVKEIFKCSEIFNLKEGLLNTLENRRKHEFLEETKNKGRRADIVLFIDGDIVIPVEVEKHGNIKAGEQQLFQYQADWIKKYGILTDGNEWRFYNDRYYETFDILHILAQTPKFLTFWNEYIQPGSYYRSFFEKKGQQLLFELPIPHLDDVREDFFKDITKLIENFKNKLNLKGYFKKEKNEVDKEKKAVEITYAYLIQFFLYKVLVDNSFSDFEEDWKVRLSSIEEALKKGVYGDILYKIIAISNKISDKIYKRFSDEQTVINDRLKEILNKPKTGINDVSVWLDILLFINRYNFSNVQNEIFGYVYENYLKDLYLNEKKGQYFTDPNVVEFMLNEIEYTKENLKNRFKMDKDSISIIDPSCGSGTFLYNATHRIVQAFYENDNKTAKIAENSINDNIFGFDIAEFPLYLAEMNILMRMLPIVINEKYNNPIEQKIKVFKTRDSVAEFLDTAIKNTLSDIDISNAKQSIQLSLFADSLDLGYDSFMRDKGDLDDLKNSLEIMNKKPRTRFDFVIGNPPYVGYNEISKQKLLFVQLLQSNNLNMSDIYGVNLNTVPGRPKPYAPKPNLYTFFIALGLALLKDNGKLCYIIPQTLLNSGDLDVMRYHLSKFVTIEKLIIFANKMFIGRGIKQKRPVPTSSLIFIVKKTLPNSNHKVKVINYLDTDKDINECLSDITKGKNIRESEILQSVLFDNISNWNFITKEKIVLSLIDDYRKNSVSIEEYRKSLDDYDLVQFDKGLVFEKSKKNKKSLGWHLIDTKSRNNFKISTSDEFIEDKYIKFPAGAQGINIYKNKYKIIWSYMNFNKFNFSDDNIMIDFNWIIISSNDKQQILKFFSILNSKTTLFIIKSLFKISNEKDLLLGIRAVKEFIKIPTLSNDIEKEIVFQANEIIEMENDTIEKYVDFNNLIMQKYDLVEIKHNFLVIKYKDKEFKCKIKENPNLIKKIISSSNYLELFSDSGISNISDLKSLPAYDIDYQLRVKDYIDDLVFSQYFRMKLPKLGLEFASEIKAICSKHKYYKLINEV